MKWFKLFSISNFLPIQIHYWQSEEISHRGGRRQWAEERRIQASSQLSSQLCCRFLQTLFRKTEWNQQGEKQLFFFGCISCQLLKVLWWELIENCICYGSADGMMIMLHLFFKTLFQKLLEWDLVNIPKFSLFAPEMRISNGKTFQECFLDLLL